MDKIQSGWNKTTGILSGCLLQTVKSEGNEKNNKVHNAMSKFLYLVLLFLLALNQTQAQGRWCVTNKIQ